MVGVLNVVVDGFRDSDNLQFITSTPGSFLDVERRPHRAVAANVKEEPHIATAKHIENLLDLCRRQLVAGRAKGSAWSVADAVYCAAVLREEIDESLGQDAFQPVF